MLIREICSLKIRVSVARLPLFDGDRPVAGIRGDV